MQLFCSVSPSPRLPYVQQEIMALSLYESLRAIGLQQHYDRLTSLGVRSLAHLSVLTLEDYPLLGIRTMDDRTRMFHLVQTLKTLDPETLENALSDKVNDSYSLEDCTTHNYKCTDNVFDGKSWSDMPSVCRQLDFSLEPTQDLVNVEPQKQYASYDFNCLPEKQHKGIRLREDSIVNLSQSSTQHADIKAKTKSTTVSPRRTSNKSTGHKENETSQKNRVHMYTEKASTQVYQSKPSEYNYGLPLTCSPSTSSKRREGDQRIWVCVRKRPLTTAETKREETDVVSTPDDRCVVVHESKEAVDLTHYVLQHRFYFDHVFGEDSSNEEVYMRTAYPLVQHMLNGGSSTCFAYGQTGAGKTHTMLGGVSSREPGLYALAIRDIFSHLSTSHYHAHLSVYVSFFEIYCGQLYDLLDHRKRLFAREDGQRTVHIAGLCHVKVDSVNSLLEVISRGTEERTQGCSGVNPQSSRSHAMLQIQLRDPHQHIHGRMWLVDLAGSERASDSRDPDKQRRMEGAEINQSLLALKECIRSLDQEQSHTPFRQSKLTQVLKDSFVGDSMTCMIANISPVHSATEHTLNTLRYADRVKELKGLGGQQHRRSRRGKTAPSPNRDQSNNRSTMGPRCKSPPKKPKLGQQNITKEGKFRSSTPKSDRSGEEKRVRKMFELISPVKSPERPRNHALVSNLHAAQRESGFCNREMEKRTTEQLKVQRNDSECDQITRDFDVNKEKKRHLKLYHQQLQQFIPETPNYSNQPSLDFSNSSSPGSYLKSFQNMIPVNLEEILGQYRATANQVKLCLPNGDIGLEKCEAEGGLSLNLKHLGEDTEAILGQNRSKSERRNAKMEKIHRNLERSRQEQEVVCANGVWSFEKQGTLCKNNKLPVASCDLRAPAERPLSPVCERSNSLLTLSALNCSSESKTVKPQKDTNKSKEVTKENRQDGSTETMNALFQKMAAKMTTLPQEEAPSAVMDPLSMSLLDVDQQPATASFLVEKPRIISAHDKEVETKKVNSEEDRLISVYMDWEPGEESYLEVPQAIGSFLIPVAIQVHSEKCAQSQTQTKLGDEILNSKTSIAAKQQSSTIFTNMAPQRDHNSKCSKTQSDTAPNPSLCENIGNSDQQRRISKHKEESHQLYTSEHVINSHWHVVQAHLETLKEMEVLSHKEGTLLSKQPDMAFVDYVQQLEEIMERKAVCVQRMIAQLQPYLKSSKSSNPQ